jgi:hypothetical protein
VNPCGRLFYCCWRLPIGKFYQQAKLRGCRGVFGPTLSGLCCWGGGSGIPTAAVHCLRPAPCPCLGGQSVAPAQMSDEEEVPSAPETAPQEQVEQKEEGSPSRSRSRSRSRSKPRRRSVSRERAPERSGGGGDEARGKGSEGAGGREPRSWERGGGGRPPYRRDRSPPPRAMHQDRRPLARHLPAEMDDRSRRGSGGGEPRSWDRRGSGGGGAHGGGSGRPAAQPVMNIKVERSSTCPLLLRVFPNEGRHHPVQSFGRGQSDKAKLPTGAEYLRCHRCRCRWRVQKAGVMACRLARC